MNASPLLAIAMSVWQSKVMGLHMHAHQVYKLWDNSTSSWDSGQICVTVPPNVGRLATMYTDSPVSCE